MIAALNENPFASWRRAALWTLSLSVLVVVPFSGKALHIDDPAYVELADQILKDPLRPYSFQLEWTLKPMHAFDDYNNPPLYCYWLAMVIPVIGRSEVALHLAMLPFTMLSVGGMLWLCCRFLKHPLIPALTLAFSPAFIPAHNVMLDVPMLGLFLGGLAIFICGIDMDHRGRQALGSVLLGLAILTKYSALVALPLMAAYAIFHSKRRALVGLLISVAILFLWGLHGWLVYGRPHFFRSGVARSWSEIGVLMQCSGRALSGCAVVFPILLALRWNRSRLVGIAFASLLALTFGWPFAGPWFQSMFEICLVLNLVALLFFLGWTAWEGATWFSGEGSRSQQGRDKLFLVLWAMSFPAFNMLVAEFVAVRYFLPSLPPLLILAFRRLEDGQVSNPKRLKTACVSTVVFTAAIGLWVSIADVEYADVYRAKALELADHLKANDGHVWFAGHWGWRHYAASSGMKQVPQADRPLPEGDVLVIPIWTPRQAPEELQRFREIARVSVNSRWLLRTGSPQDRGGYYKVTKHMLPYAIETGEFPLETFVIYRVGALR